MMSQETINFVEDIVKTILSRWESLPVYLRDKMTVELMSVFFFFFFFFLLLVRIRKR